MRTSKSPSKRNDVKIRRGAAETRNSHRLLKELGGNPNNWFEPSPDSAARWKSIPLLDEPPKRTRPRTGRVIYDSWKMGPATALRDVPDGQIRRLELQAGRFSLEIVAERARGHWEFVARIYRDKAVEHQFVMLIGQLRLLAGADGFYHWSSKAVLHTVQAVSYEDNLTFGGIEW